MEFVKQQSLFLFTWSCCSVLPDRISVRLLKTCAKELQFDVHSFSMLWTHTLSVHYGKSSHSSSKEVLSS